MTTRSMTLETRVRGEAVWALLCRTALRGIDWAARACGAKDMVATNIGLTLDAGCYVEALRTTANAGTSAINLAGNEIAQSITGNAGANTIFGRGGNDVMHRLKAIQRRAAHAARPGAGSVAESTVRVSA